MAAMTLRLPDDLHDQLREAAERGGHSLHAEILIVLENYVSSREILRNEVFRRLIAENREALDILADS